MNSYPVRVVLVEDDADTCAALKLSVESDPRMRLVATFDTVAGAVQWIDKNSLDVLVTDLGLPDGSGVEVIHSCALRHPSCDILVVTVSSDEASVVACIEAGATGYVLKDSTSVDIARSILDLRAGGAPISPLVARLVLAKVRNRPKPPATVPPKPALPVSALTKRESDILELIARGDSYSEVAKGLSVSVGTVQTHIKNIYSKLAVHSRGEAVFEAHRRGLLHMTEVSKPPV